MKVIVLNRGGLTDMKKQSMNHGRSKAILPGEFRTAYRSYSKEKTIHAIKQDGFSLKRHISLALLACLTLIELISFIYNI